MEGDASGPVVEAPNPAGGAALEVSDDEAPDLETAKANLRNQQAQKRAKKRKAANTAPDLTLQPSAAENPEVEQPVEAA